MVCLILIASIISCRQSQFAAAHRGMISVSNAVARPLPASSRVIGPSAHDDGNGGVYRKWPGQPFYERGVGQSRGQQSDWPTSVLFPLLITAKVCRKYWALSCRFSHWASGLVSGMENTEFKSCQVKKKCWPPPSLRCTEREPHMLLTKNLLFGKKNIRNHAKLLP